MPTHQFLKDRRRGHPGQDYVAKRLTDIGYTVRVVKDGFFQDYDFVAEHTKKPIRFTGEVKTCYWFDKTHNFALELDALRHSKAPMFFYVVMKNDKPLEAYYCPLEPALKVAEEHYRLFPDKIATGERGEISPLVPKDFLLSRVQAQII